MRESERKRENARVERKTFFLTVIAHCNVGKAKKSPSPRAKTSENERKRNERKRKEKKKREKSTRHGQTKGRRKRKGRKHMRKTKFIENTHISRYQRIIEETIAGNSLGSLPSFSLLPVFKAQETFGRKRLNPRFFCTTIKTEKK